MTQREERPKVHVSELEEEDQVILREGVKTYRRLKARESAIAQQKKSLSQHFLRIVKENGERSIDVCGALVSYTKAHERTNFDRDKAMQGLLEAGVDPTVAQAAFAAAESKTAVAENVQVK